MCRGNRLRWKSCFAAMLLAAGPGFAADWPVKEETKPYAISGSTGLELYRSIGERGPLLGGSSRAIAHTMFDLKWSRDYRPQRDGSCKLVSARPFLTITYTVPRPSEALPAGTAQLWSGFIEGIMRHERVHGEHMREMVETIHRTTVGMSAANDPGCRKIREAIQVPLAAASREQRRKSMEFDREEMGVGGTVRRLVRDLTGR